MPGFSLLTDLMVALGAYVCSVAFTLRWVYQSEQAVVSKTPKTIRMVLLRLAIVVGILLGACKLTDVALWIPITVFGLLMLPTLGSDILGLPGLIVFWVVQQYVLGFPEREGLILQPSESSAIDHSEPNSHSQHIGQRATTTCALKPTGEIIIGDARHAATSETGGYIGPKEIVIVTGFENGSLLVRSPLNPTEE